MNQFRSNDEAIQEARRFASSPQADQLKALLHQPNAQGLKTAMEQAAGGDLAGAKSTIETFLTTQDGKALLEQLRKNP